jgi:hypothetical protein
MAAVLSNGKNRSYDRPFITRNYHRFTLSLKVENCLVIAMNNQMINNNLQIGHERKPALANLQVVSIQHTLAYA